MQVHHNKTKRSLTKIYSGQTCENLLEFVQRARIQPGALQEAEKNYENSIFRCRSS